jgi:hypothetical protein
MSVSVLCRRYEVHTEPSASPSAMLALRESAACAISTARGRSKWLVPFRRIRQSSGNCYRHSARSRSIVGGVNGVNVSTRRW